MAGRVLLPGQGAGEELQLDLGVAQFLGDLEEFQGAAAEPLHLVHHEGHPRPQRAVLAGRRQGRLHFGALADPGADPFLEKPVYAGGFEGVDLGLDLLRPAGDAGVREPDLHRHGRRRELLHRQGLPGGAGMAYGRGGDVQLGAERGDELEARGVVLERDLAGGGAAGRARRGLAVGHRAGVRLDEPVRIGDHARIVSEVRFTSQEEGNGL